MSGENPQDSFSADRAELFETLGHPTRIKILELLSNSSQGFSELKKALNIESGGQLQFHLGKLKDLVKTTSEGNYELTDEGKEAIRIVSMKEPRTDRPKITRKRTNVLTVGTIVILVVLVISFAYLAYSYSSQLESTNMIIQQNFVQRNFNYTIVLSYNTSSSSNGGQINAGGWNAVQLTPTIQNITLVPVDEAKPLTTFLQFNNTPLDNWIYPMTIEYAFQNNSLSSTTLSYHHVIPIVNSTYNETIDTNVTYYTYIGQIVVAYPKDSSDLTFNFMHGGPLQTQPDAFYWVVTYKAQLPP
jgi:DNA-binding transcriptional ArsR family regulator